jgi:hypothetical protein
VEAARAQDALVGLDVVVSSDDLALLERLGRRGTATPVRAASLARDGSAWIVACGDTRVRLPASKGLAYLAELVANPGVERHALDLVDRVEGVHAEGVDRRALGDAGEMLDGKARAAYRARVEELRADINSAFDAGADTRAEELQAELDLLVAELSRAFGVGGRERRSASAAERARLNVTRSLRTAVTRVTDALPDAGAALDRGLRTGIYCRYEPKPDEPVRWIVQS